jgi:NAD(P)-dependent dehydrogenase (short-subunit alcohol dehydrogenase family)
LLASRGARVVVNDNGSAIVGDGTDSGPAQEVVDEIKALGSDAVAITESVATEAGGKAIVEAALDSFGRIDILIHSAGNVRYGSLSEISYEDFKAIIDVHLMGAFHVVRPAFPLMAAAGYGRVVLTSSIGGIYGNRNVVPYGMSKAGMIGLSNIIGIEGAEHSIKSNIILPGAVTRMSEAIDTSQFTPMEPEKVAAVVGYLCHEDCAVSGEMYVSAAGRVARAYVAETEGIYHPSWTIEDVADNLDAIRDTSNAWLLPPVPSGFMDHLGRSFEMARAGGA